MNEFLSLSFLLWFFKTDDYVQKLISETHQSDSEVNNHGLTHDFRSVFGIGKFSCEIKFKSFIVIDKVVCQPNVLLSCSINDVLFEQRIDGWIKLFIDVFKETSATSLDGVLKILNECVWSFIHVKSLEEWTFVFFLDPVHSLQLRIDTKRPSCSFCSQDTILN